jgi:LmbE family N-acetylglucosaminyl deacetylase
MIYTKPMKKIIFGIFAHPDDEAFGPAGAFLMETKAGSEVHLITLTNGDGGTNPDNHDDLGAVRLAEWHNAGALIGVTGMHFLGYKDGQLNNESMIEASQRIHEIVQQTLAGAPPDSVVEFMTNDLNGISGHIDHIVAARAACFVFDSLKQTDTRFSRMRLACIVRSALPTSNVHWLFMEAGRTASEIDEIVDARYLQPEILAIMRAHHTQRADGENHIERLGDQLGLYYFMVRA